MWIERNIEDQIDQAAGVRPAILLTGIRQSGKSALLRKMFPEAKYLTLDKVITAMQAEENPHAFLESVSGAEQVILDEVQYAPSLFRELKIRIDENRTDYGKWILTGSQKFALMNQVSESLAGRIGIFQMETLSARELRECGFFPDIGDIVWKGGFPEIWANAGIDPAQYFEDYIQTYLERDLRAVMQVTSLRDYQRFMRVCAARAGQLLNFSDIAKDVGMSVNTVRAWINALETSGLITLIAPYSANIGKRLVKAPKLFFADQGLLCALLNIRQPRDIEGHIYEGQIWENFVFTELMKASGVRPSVNLFFYRDQNGVEIDFLIEEGRTLFLIEVKSSEMVSEAKLNFKKVSPLFEGRVTNHILACRCLEKKRIILKNYSIYNPVFDSFDLEDWKSI